MRKKQIPFSLCFMLTLCLLGSPARAQRDTTYAEPDLFELNEVKITAARIPMAPDHVARTVKILDRATLSALPVNTVNDLLKFAAGVDVRQRGVNGMQTDISIRGGTADQIAVYLNGISIVDPQTGHNVFSLPLEISDIERIEVLEGPAGRAYGSSSLTGAINIVTRKEQSSNFSARLEAGSYGTVEAGGRFHLSQTLRTGVRLQQSLSGGYGRSDGYSKSRAGQPNSDWQNGHLFYEGQLSAPLFDVNWHFGFLDKDFGSNTFYSTASDEQFEHVRKYMTAVSAQTRGKIWTFRPAFYWNRSEDRFEFFRGKPDQSPYNYHQTDVFGLNLNNEVSWVAGKTAFGAEMRNEGVVSTNLGEPLNTVRPVPKGSLPKQSGGKAEFRNGLNRTHISFFLEHTVLLRHFTLSAGVAAVKNTGNEMKFRFYPGADLCWKINSLWDVYASYNTSLRMPTFTELYYSVGGHQADKFLEPEQIQAVELGTRFNWEGIHARLNFYYHHGTGLIDWIKDFSAGPDAPWESVNHGAIQTWGAEPQVQLDFKRLISKDLFLNTLDLSYSYIWQDKKTSPQIQSKYALEYLRHQFSARLGMNLWSRLNLLVSCRWLDRAGTYQSGEELCSYQPYTLLDAQLSWDMPAWRVFLCGNNLLNKSYYDYGNIPQPGLWIRAGISCHLK